MRQEEIGESLREIHLETLDWAIDIYTKNRCLETLATKMAKKIAQEMLTVIDKEVIESDRKN